MLQYLNQLLVSICYKDDTSIETFTGNDNVIGIDLGINSLATLSNGTSIENLKFLKKHISKLKYQSRYLSKKQKGSKNRNKARHKLAICHETIRNKRNDYLHKVTHKLANDNQVATYVVEDLKVSNMLQNHKLAQAISDCSWNEFTRQLQYKLKWQGKKLIKVNPKYTSMICNNCGNINRDLKLQDREWICSNCNKLHNRDLNAAINIRNKGYRNYSLKPVDLPTLVGDMKQETLFFRSE